jgi:hypothetical protein
VKLVSDVGIWKIVAHIAFKFYSVASGTFSTPSTLSSAATAIANPKGSAFSFFVTSSRLSNRCKGTKRKIFIAADEAKVSAVIRQ